MTFVGVLAGKTMDDGNNNGLKAIISARVNSSLKEAYEKWWRSKGYVSEAEALRDHIREVTNFDMNGQEKSCPT